MGIDRVAVKLHTSSWRFLSRLLTFGAGFYENWVSVVHYNRRALTFFFEPFTGGGGGPSSSEDSHWRTEGNCAPAVSTALPFVLLAFAFPFAAAAFGAFSVLMAFALVFMSAFTLALAFVPDFASDVVLIFKFPADLGTFVPAVFSFCWRLGCSAGLSSLEAAGVERTGRYNQ